MCIRVNRECVCVCVRHSRALSLSLLCANSQAKKSSGGRRSGGVVGYGAGVVWLADFTRFWRRRLCEMDAFNEIGVKQKW